MTATTKGTLDLAAATAAACFFFTAVTTIYLTTLARKRRRWKVGHKGGVGGSVLLNHMRFSGFSIFLGGRGRFLVATLHFFF